MRKEIMDHLTYLVEAIGSRAIGTAANHQAADYIQNIFRSAGLEVEVQPFDCPAWSVRDAFVELNG